MAPGKDNMSESVSILTQHQLDKFVREYRIPLDLNPVLPSKDETIYPFRQGKFPLYTRVFNFANYRVPFSVFLIRVLQFFRVHICQVNSFGLSRINHFEISCRGQDRRPDLNVFRYFYEFITAGDWYTFAHRKGIPPPSSDERSSLKNWKDNFFWLDDRCLPEDMRWRFKDQSMSFDLGEDFTFDQELARALIEHKSPIRPLHEHFLLLGRVCFSWSQGDRDWPVIRRKCDRVVMSLRDALMVPSFDILDFDLDDQGEGEVPLMKQVAYAAQEIRPLVTQDAAEPSNAEATSSVPTPTKDAVGSSGTQIGKKSILDDVDSDPEDAAEPSNAEATSSVPTPTKDAAGSSGTQTGKKSILDDVDSDPEVHSIDEALQYPPSVSLKSKGVMPEVGQKILFRKRKNESLQICSSDPLPMPKPKKNKKGSSHSGSDVMVELDEHLTGGKHSREEAALARSAPTPTFSGGFLPVNEVESMEVENPEAMDKGDGKTRGEPKVVTFSGTNLDSSLGLDHFIDDEEDQVTSLPSSWFGPGLMSFFRYADVFSDDMEIDPATTEEKFIPDWDIRNKIQ
ncbi:hypothetical protein HanRHA438_Chr13g0617361 [Helianthus annuus]|uniref:Transposase (Putative), gypsy type n=1 Tax=Helianthus annuus TaxID=4232 RepID=A0A9K3EKM4_HELAN|nr:hypothetical protein HanXRQr2_Chr13g0607091 [Helianthus annuus]KAJ0478212.1 hypothetical protein HanHA300_Chr13g0497731 [Helianthus annuus]KAJ0499096.1 hypothetical protein HanHA89_Chr13g0530401 [Helianthus annuus]KAJ0665110.1 hypothetical protein HanLR1_Chr13g0500431 [Helianthus annuus]KAJ0672528.1 hypothetical protein HanOQP8_Chr13g0498371 [Helianthus annuus]